ncbi:MAG: hypothetical protein IT492_23475, partial [Gammaproteobacteria bacterium]|nr:hypothetical protein [Gammaproteobacteria bacterium]
MTSIVSTPFLSAFRMSDVATPAPGAPASPVAAPGGTIWVERTNGKRLEQLDGEWADLVTRASEPNVFMHPALLQSLGDEVVTLLAWYEAGGVLQLIGVWAFVLARVTLVQALRSPPFPHSYLATPVVDRNQAEAALSAMLDYVEQTRDLPKSIWLDPIRLDGPTMHALAKVVSARRGSVRVVTSTARPVLASDLDGKQYFEKALSSSSRKKLRQHRRRLEEKGVLDSVIYTTTDEVKKA